ncbi:MAG: protoporphyrinogen oxidase [Actinomycetota bacterium]
MTQAARSPEETDVVVVGGGITGLAAARDLARAGARVTLVDPASPGGKVRTSPFDGALLDESADAFLARVPDAVELCRELGIQGDLVAPGARRAYVWSRGALRLLPEGQVLGVPTDLDELAGSGILSPEGLARARLDLEVPMQAPEDDVTIGALMRTRLGDEVADRLVDPLVGGINAGDTDHLSLAATVPQLDAAARSGASSLIEACRAQRAAVTDPSAPVFFAPRTGMGALVDAVHGDASASGLVTVCGTAVGLERDGSRWRVSLLDGHVMRAAAVIIATPAGVASALVGRHAPLAGSLLSDIPYASVAMISIAVDRSAVDRDLDGSGFLVPRVESRAITACSWASSKWPHLAGGDAVWLRTSVGRDGDDRGTKLDDETLVQATLTDLADTMSLRGAPREVRVTRWPASLPQYRPGHLGRVAQIETDLASAMPSVVVTGAAFRGLGVPACIRQGRAAAQKVLTALSPHPG